MVMAKFLCKCLCCTNNKRSHIVKVNFFFSGKDLHRFNTGQNKHYTSEYCICLSIIIQAEKKTQVTNKISLLSSQSWHLNECLHYMVWLAGLPARTNYPLHRQIMIMRISRTSYHHHFMPYLPLSRDHVSAQSAI